MKEDKYFENSIREVWQKHPELLKGITTKIENNTIYTILGKVEDFELAKSLLESEAQC